MNVKSLIESFSDLRVLIVGDMMIDSYLWGTVNRISPEAPVPVVSVNERSKRLGGAANVGRNIRSLGAQAVMASVVGADGNGIDLIRLLEEQGIGTEGIVRSENRKTTLKTRVISGHQHIVRVDDEQTDNIQEEEERMLLDKIKNLLESGSIDVVVLEDYNKGTLTTTVIGGVIALAAKNQIPVAVDPKKENFLAYKGVQLFKPNLKELREGLKLDIDPTDRTSIKNAVDMLRKQLDHQMTMLTLSEYGLYVEDGNNEQLLPAHERSISDVSGAGDSVIATAALCLASGADISDMAILSNLAGGIVCEKVGVVPIGHAELCREALEVYTG